MQEDFSLVRKQILIVTEDLKRQSDVIDQLKTTQAEVGYSFILTDYLNVIELVKNEPFRIFPTPVFEFQIYLFAFHVFLKV